MAPFIRPEDVSWFTGITYNPRQIINSSIRGPLSLSLARCRATCVSHTSGFSTMLFREAKLFTFRLVSSFFFFFFFYIFSTTRGNSKDLKFERSLFSQRIIPSLSCSFRKYEKCPATPWIFYLDQSALFDEIWSGDFGCNVISETASVTSEYQSISDNFQNWNTPPAYISLAKSLFICSTKRRPYLHSCALHCDPIVEHNCVVTRDYF